MLIKNEILSWVFWVGLGALLFFAFGWIGLLIGIVVAVIEDYENQNNQKLKKEK